MSQPRWAGDERWHPIVQEAVRLRQLSGEESVRVLVGDHAVLVSGDDHHVVGVVFIKGHPVVKSVVRMVRQMLRPPGASANGGKRRSKPKKPEAPAGSDTSPALASQVPARGQAPAEASGEPGLTPRPVLPGARPMLRPAVQDPRELAPSGPFVPTHKPGSHPLTHLLPQPGSLGQPPGSPVGQAANQGPAIPAEPGPGVGARHGHAPSPGASSAPSGTGTPLTVMPHPDEEHRH